MADSSKQKGSTRTQVDKLKLGDIPLDVIYHTGAVIMNRNGKHLLLLDDWAAREGGQPGVRAIACDADGNIAAEAKEGLFTKLPTTALYRPDTKKARAWEGVIVLAKSARLGLPAGITTESPALLLVPFGPLYGQVLGHLSAADIADIAKSSTSLKFKRALAEVTRLPAERNWGASMRLSDSAKKRLYKDQDAYIRLVPVVDVMERLCGQQPDQVKGGIRRYTVNGVIINFEPDKNRWGALGHDFQAFSGRDKKGGSSHNAFDVATAMAELIGGPRDFNAVRKALIETFGLQSKMDRMYEDALSRENASCRSGKAVDPSVIPEMKIDSVLKGASAVTKTTVESPFDLAKGYNEDADEEKRRKASFIGGFEPSEKIWPEARRFLVETRKLDADMIDRLYADGRIFATENRQGISIVAPARGIKNSGIIVGVDTKPLPRPGAKLDSRNHGSTGQGAFMMGAPWGPGLKRAVICEGFIKALAYVQIFKVDAETAVLARSGANPSMSLIPLLKEWGTEAVIAYDNDHAGRINSLKFMEECNRQGVKCSRQFVEPAETTVWISQKFDKPQYHDAVRAKAMEASITRWADDHGVPWAEESQATMEGYRGIRMPNNDKVIFALEKQMIADRAVSHAEWTIRTKGMPDKLLEGQPKEHWLKASYHNKDWDDILKSPFHPQVPEWNGARVAAGRNVQMPAISSNPADLLAVRTHLVDGCGINPWLIESVLGLKAAYPTREPPASSVNPAKAGSKSNPLNVVFDMISHDTGQRSAFARRGLNGDKQSTVGLKTHAGFRLGAFSDESKVLAIAGSPIEAMSLWTALESQFGRPVVDNICIVGLCDNPSPAVLLDEAKKRGIERVLACYNSDPIGRKLNQDIVIEAQSRGMEAEPFMPASDVTMKHYAKPRFEMAVAPLTSHLKEMQYPVQSSGEEPGSNWVTLTFPNTAKVCEIAERIESQAHGFHSIRGRNDPILETRRDELMAQLVKMKFDHKYAPSKSPGGDWTLNVANGGPEGRAVKQFLTAVTAEAPTNIDPSALSSEFKPLIQFAWAPANFRSICQGVSESQWAIDAEPRVNLVEFLNRPRKQHISREVPESPEEPGMGMT